MKRYRGWLVFVILLGTTFSKTLSAGPNTCATASTFVEAAMKQIGVTLYYDPAYVRLDFPGGDVPLDRGVCTDVIIRAYRHIGVDLQLEVNKDMRSNFGVYPKKWGLKKPDRNIDHRRVWNLMKWFERKGASLRVSDDPADYRPGDIVAWQFDNGLPHIGIVSSVESAQPGTPLMVHNVGQGTLLEDVLFTWKIIGHYRFIPGRN